MAVTGTAQGSVLGAVRPACLVLAPEPGEDQAERPGVTAGRLRQRTAAARL